VITREQTEKTVQAHRVHAKDTGSSSVQVALLTERILHLSGHLKTHPKDHHSRRGLLQMVSHRSSLLRYLSRTEPKRHASLLEKLGIRK
jgi:small subunit ribosomal protein S15